MCNVNVPFGVLIGSSFSWFGPNIQLLHSCCFFICDGDQAKYLCRPLRTNAFPCTHTFGGHFWAMWVARRHFVLIGPPIGPHLVYSDGTNSTLHFTFNLPHARGIDLFMVSWVVANGVAILVGTFRFVKVCFLRRVSRGRVSFRSFHRIGLQRAGGFMKNAAGSRTILNLFVVRAIPNLQRCKFLFATFAGVVRFGVFVSCHIVNTDFHAENIKLVDVAICRFPQHSKCCLVFAILFFGFMLFEVVFVIVEQYLHLFMILFLRYVYFAKRFASLCFSCLF